MHSFIKEFKEFAIKGNVIDLAVGVIIGAAFSKIVSSLVSDIIMPPIGLLVGGVNFTDLKIQMTSLLGNKTPVTINYGNFLQALFDFLIVASVVFIMVKLINKLKKSSEAEAIIEKAEITSKEALLLTEIRDLLANQNTPIPQKPEPKDWQQD